MIKKLNDQEMIEVLNNNEDFIMILAMGHDCGLCHAAEFRIAHVYSKKFPNISIYNIDITENPLFRGNHIVFRTPTLLIFERSKEIFRESGFIKWENLDSFLKKIYD